MKKFCPLLEHFKQRANQTIEINTFLTISKVPLPVKHLTDGFYVGFDDL